MSITATPLQAQMRDQTGCKGHLSSLRRQGWIPGIVYGFDKTSLPVAVCQQQMLKEFAQKGCRTRLFSMDVPGQGLQHVLIQDIAFDPVTDQPIHMDFLQVMPGQKVKVTVPLEYINADKSPGLKFGVVLHIAVKNIVVKADMQAIPSSLPVDLTGAATGRIFHLEDVMFPEGVSPLSLKPLQTVAIVLATRRSGKQASEGAS